MTNKKLFQKFPEIKEQKLSNLFDSYTASDFAVVTLDSIAEPDFTPDGVARVIVHASDECRKPVNLRVTSQQDKIELVPGPWVSLIGSALTNLGYQASYHPHKGLNGYDYLLEKIKPK